MTKAILNADWIGPPSGTELTVLGDWLPIGLGLIMLAGIGLYIATMLGIAGIESCVYLGGVIELACR